MKGLKFLQPQWAEKKEDVPQFGTSLGPTSDTEMLWLWRLWRNSGEASWVMGKCFLNHLSTNPDILFLIFILSDRMLTLLYLSFGQTVAANLWQRWMPNNAGKAQLLPWLTTKLSKADMKRSLDNKGRSSVSQYVLTLLPHQREQAIIISQNWCWNPGRSRVLWLGVGEADSQSPFWAALGPAHAEAVPTCACYHQGIARRRGSLSHLWKL